LSSNDQVSNEKTYTMSQIKEAFFKEFHRSGEVFFDYLGDDLSAHESTQAIFDDFAQRLEALQSLEFDTDTKPI